VKFIETKIKGVYEIECSAFSDERGGFYRIIDKEDFAQINFTKEFVQVNRSGNFKKGTLRGMHFQLPPFSETKVIQCIKGKVFDVAVDLRKNSPTFLHWISMELSEENRKIILIPEGCAHGFQTLEDNSEILYLHTQSYKPDFQSAIRFDEPLVNIQWKIPVSVISERDKNHPLLDKSFKGLEV
jgi:dTDP-4-dehydrorhamnose 3,5-epimerase